MANLSNLETPSSTSTEPRTVRVALLGFGTVGEGTYRMIHDNMGAVRNKTGARIKVVGIGIRDESKPRSLPGDQFTTDLKHLVTRADVDVVIEVMGGEQPAADLIETALRAGKHVVTANKELIAKHGSRLITLARDLGLDLHFEAAVGGGIPVVQPLKHQLAGNDVLKLMGILNGTTNYILSQMTQTGKDFEVALAEAQAKGYAEADPTNDVDGFDTMYKVSILAAISFGKQVPLDGVYREGIRKITAADIKYADMLGYRIKLLGVCEESGPGTVQVRVHPALLPKSHQLAHVEDVYNAVWIRADFAGDLMFSGRGAGADPTASAVVGDLVDVVRNICVGGSGSAIPYGTGQALSPIADLQTRYYLRMEVVDRPGTLGEIATAFGEGGVGLAAMEMRTKDQPGLGEIVFFTHTGREGDFVAALRLVEGLPCVRRIENWIRVEE